MKSSKIFGLGWNWKGGSNVKPFPVIFQKALSSIILNGETVLIPKDSTVIHEGN